MGDVADANQAVKPDVGSVARSAHRQGRGTGHTWAPVYETLYQGEKRGLTHVARSVFVGLLIEAKKVRLGGVVPLPRGERDAAAGVREIVGGKLEEVTAAVVELSEEPDAMIRVEGRAGRLSVRIMSWSTRWVLGEADLSTPDHEAEPTPASSSASGSDLRSIRKHLRWTQAAAAAHLGIPRTTVADVEAGRRQLRADQMASLLALVSQNVAANVTQNTDAAATSTATCRENVATSAATSGDIDCDMSQECRDMSQRDGGVRGGLSGVQTQEIRGEDRRSEERESPARARDTAATSGRDAVRHVRDIGHLDRDTAATSDTATATRPGLPAAPRPVPAGIASAEDLLSWVAAHACLRALVSDPASAREWAEDAAGGMGMAGTRAEDVHASIAEYVTQHGSAARRMSRQELKAHIGAFLKRAKAHGDIARARQQRGGSGGTGPRQVVPLAPSGGRPIVENRPPPPSDEEVDEIVRQAEALRQKANGGRS